MMAQQLGVLTAVPENQGWLASIYMNRHTCKQATHTQTKTITWKILSSLHINQTKTVRI